MSPATACPFCGSQVGAVPWAWSHAPRCPQHQPLPDDERVPA